MHGSLNSLHSSSSLVLAKPNDTNSSPLAGFVQKYILVTAMMHTDSGEKRTFNLCLARVHWLSPHDYQHCFPCPIKVWCVYSHSVGQLSFIPAYNIICRCAHVIDMIHFCVALNNFSGV